PPARPARHPPLRPPRLRGRAAALHALLPSLQVAHAPTLDAPGPPGSLPALPLAHLARLPPLLSLGRPPRTARRRLRPTPRRVAPASGARSEAQPRVGLRPQRREHALGEEPDVARELVRRRVAHAGHEAGDAHLGQGADALGDAVRVARIEAGEGDDV